MRLGSSLNDYFYGRLSSAFCGSTPDMANTLPAENSLYYSLNAAVVGEAINKNHGDHDVDTNQDTR